MANPEAKVQALLRQHRFKLVRQTRHLVFVNPHNQLTEAGGGRMRTLTMLRLLYQCPRLTLTVLRVLAWPPSRARFDKAFVESQAYYAEKVSE